jgi:hypothetical protein
MVRSPAATSSPPGSPVLPVATIEHTTTTRNAATTTIHNAATTIPNTATTIHNATTTTDHADKGHGDTSSWLARNPGVSALPIHHTAPLTEAQKASCKISSIQRKLKEEALSKPIAEITEAHTKSISKVADQHGTSIQKVTALVAGLTTYKKAHEPTLNNAMMFMKAKEVNTGEHLVKCEVCPVPFLYVPF